MSQQSQPITVEYFYRVRWGRHDEWLELFRRNHWPLLREGLASGRYLDVRLAQPRFHGHGAAEWDVLVTITYRDWAALEEHTPRELVERLYPDQERFNSDEQRRFELLEAHWEVVLEQLDLPDE